jgi:hypothetical protein
MEGQPHMTMNASTAMKGQDRDADATAEFGLKSARLMAADRCAQTCSVASCSVCAPRLVRKASTSSVWVEELKGGGGYVGSGRGGGGGSNKTGTNRQAAANRQQQTGRQSQKHNYGQMGWLVQAPVGQALTTCSVASCFVCAPRCWSGRHQPHMGGGGVYVCVCVGWWWWGQTA